MHRHGRIYDNESLAYLIQGLKNFQETLDITFKDTINTFMQLYKQQAYIKCNGMFVAILL